jgi:hypothetical protein
LIKAITAITDATSIITALAPLVQGALDGGKEVTEADVAAALKGKDAAIARLDALIEAKS